MQAHLNQVERGLQQLQASSMGMLHTFNTLAAEKAGPQSAQQQHGKQRPPCFVASHLNANKDDLQQYWREFDLEGEWRVLCVCVCVMPRGCFNCVSR